MGERQCGSFAFVFDFQFTGPSEINLNSVPQENVYFCHEVIAFQQSSLSDWAVIEARVFPNGTDLEVGSTGGKS